ncbi:cell division protein FtsX [Candidatus Tenderia electrophaga]|jgi:lipoprotein-releasing system permease protein|uniref:Cell division protein FtsX n=1 Tax=Candidatus Tenderia electrophaga TaxID=1748243 RepID=A0A0S2TE45_9GAMM|nr:cell division protein FtsX [Candidatus Tenderia electrophaga]
MFKPLELFIGLRYTRAKRRNHFISFISFISIAGIALGVTALITVLSVMNGFEQELRTRILGVASHMVVSSASDGLERWQRLDPYLQRYPQIQGMAPFVRGEGMLTAGAGVSGSIIRGVAPTLEPQVSTLDQTMVAGALSDLKAGAFNIILGQELARQLGVRVGDKVTLVTPQASVTPIGIMPRLKRFSVAGVFEAGMYEFDSALALIHIEDAAKLFLQPGQVSGVRLKLDDMFEAPYLTQLMVQDLPHGFVITDWTRQHVNFFRAVKTEKIVMFVILTLIVAVAAFNIVSTLVMVVTDKKADIAILRTLGISPGAIMRIFIVQGVVIGLFGTLLGVAGGVALASNVEVIVPAIERALGMKFLSPDVYYISDLPSEMRGADIVTISVVAFVLCLAATVYPAWRASRTQPAEALRYE